MKSSRKSWRVLSKLVTLVIVGFLIQLAIYLIENRGSLKERMRRLNKRALNPIVLKFAGRPYSPHAVITHVGRKSRHTFATPVLAGYESPYFFVPIGYGTHVDWLKNIEAAGKFTLTWQGKVYEMVEPELVSEDAVGGAFPDWLMLVLHRAGVTQYLRSRVMVKSVMPEAVKVG